MCVCVGGGGGVRGLEGGKAMGGGGGEEEVDLQSPLASGSSSDYFSWGISGLSVQASRPVQSLL